MRYKELSFDYFYLTYLSMDTEDNNQNEEFFDDSPMNSDEEADRVRLPFSISFQMRKFRGKGREVIYKEVYLTNLFEIQEEMLMKLEEMKSVYEENILNKMRVQKRNKGVPWIEKLDTSIHSQKFLSPLASEKSVQIVSSDINDDIQREVAL